jgi:8-oxo-dGTP diphosphatase
MNSEPEHLGAFIIVIKDNKVLLGKRKNSFRSGSYGCPGGTLELTESIEDCAKRELEEECGIKAISLKYMGVVRELQDGYNFIHFGFACTEWTGEIKVTEPDKCEGWNFYDKGELPNNILPAHIAGIKLLDEPTSEYVEILEK